MNDPLPPLLSSPRDLLQALNPGFLPLPLNLKIPTCHLFTRANNLALA